MGWNHQLAKHVDDVDVDADGVDDDDDNTDENFLLMMP